jgi:hypothetical protein
MCARVTAENYLIKLSRVPHKNQVIASIQLTLIPVLLDNKEQIQWKFSESLHIREERKKDVQISFIEKTQIDNVLFALQKATSQKTLECTNLGP